MSTRPEHDLNKVAQETLAEGSTGSTAGKPEWSRPEITSFKPVSDAQGISYRRGDGLTNSST